MTKKYTITKVFKADKNKDGIAYAYKNGKYAGQNFFRVSIKTAETGEDYYSANVMAGHKELDLAEGQSVLLSLYEDNGFKNFRIPNKEDLAAYVTELESKQ